MVPSATLAPFSCAVPRKRLGGSVLNSVAVGVGAGVIVGVGATVGSGVGSTVAVGVRVGGAGVGEAVGVVVGDSPPPQPLVTRTAARIKRGTNMAANFRISSPFRFVLALRCKWKVVYEATV